MLGSTRQYVQTYAYVCIASHRRICEATSPYGLTIVTTTFLFALMLFITSAGLAGVVHGSCAAQFLVAHFQHIQAGEGTVGFVYTGVERMKSARFAQLALPDMVYMLMFSIAFFPSIFFRLRG